MTQQEAWGRTVEAAGDAKARVSLAVEGMITLAIGEDEVMTVKHDALIYLTPRQSSELRQALEQAEQRATKDG